MWAAIAPDQWCWNALSAVRHIERLEHRVHAHSVAVTHRVPEVHRLAVLHDHSDLGVRTPSDSARSLAVVPTATSIVIGRPRRPGGRRSFNPAMKRTSTRWGIRAEPKVPGCRTYRSCPRERRRASVPLSGERATRLEPESQAGTCRRSLGDVEIPPRRAVDAAGESAKGGCDRHVGRHGTVEGAGRPR